MGPARNKSNRSNQARLAGGRTTNAKHILGWVAAGILIGSLGQWLIWPLANGKLAEPETVPPNGPEKVPSASGQWGDLEVTPMVLERPDEVLNDYKPTDAIRWFFPRNSWPEVASLIQSCELTERESAVLLATNRWQHTTNGWEVSPPLEFVGQLNEGTREKLYSILAESPDNPQRYPFSYREDRFDDLFHGSELSADKIALVRRLSYRKQGLLHFADGQLFELTSSSNETRCLFKALLRVPTMLVRLRVDPNSDLDALVRYWGSNGRDRELKPLLQSVANLPGGGHINISYLLPPVPRLRLYTYPRPTNGPRADCFWTSFSFFGERPGYRLADKSYAQRLLEHDYIPWRGERQLGDVMILMEDDLALHACTYIADDIYFTKNGRDSNQPWVLMQMKDIMSEYTSDRPKVWKVYRRKSA